MESVVERANASIRPVVRATNDDDLEDDFSKGVVFYLKDEKIVGIVLWNVFNRIHTARAVIDQATTCNDINEIAKHFDIHT